jgi:hypothetical protein
MKEAHGETSSHRGLSFNGAKKEILAGLGPMFFPLMMSPSESK